MITVKCSCGKTYQVKDSYANKKAKCTCGKVLSVPDISAEELDKQHEKFSFSCTNCGKTFNVSKKFMGKKVRCKTCSTVQTIPSKPEEVDTHEIEDDAPTKDADQENEKTDIKDDHDDHDDHDVDTSSEKQAVAQTKSSEKPKRVLIICLIMVLLGAIAYGIFIFYADQKGEDVPKEKTPSAETDLKKPSESIAPTVQEKAESEDTTVDDGLEDKDLEKTQSESEDVQPKTEPIKPEPNELQSKVKKKAEESLDQQPAPKIPENEKIPDTSLTPESTQPEPSKEMNKQELTAAIDPKILTEDTKKYLRSSPMTYTKKQVADMIQKYNFYEANYNPNGGFPNRFVDNRNGTITDNETLLMWQKSGTREMVSWKKAPEYIDRLNNRKFSGYSDWRLPTLEELLTLTEPRHSRQGLYISSFFSQKQGIVASSDSCNYDGKNLPWYISFLRGISNCISYNLIDEFHVRAVRTMDRPDKQMHN